MGTDTNLPAPTSGLMSSLRATFNRMLNSISDDPQPELSAPVANPIDDAEVFDETQLTSNQPNILIEFDDLKRSRLPWFDSRIDYMTYVSLREAQELPVVPRLSSRYRVQMIWLHDWMVCFRWLNRFQVCNIRRLRLVCKRLTAMV